MARKAKSKIKNFIKKHEGKKLWVAIAIIGAIIIIGMLSGSSST